MIFKVFYSSIFRAQRVMESKRPVLLLTTISVRLLGKNTSRQQKWRQMRKKKGAHHLAATVTLENIVEKIALERGWILQNKSSE